MPATEVMATQLFPDTPYLYSGKYVLAGVDGLSSDQISVMTPVEVSSATKLYAGDTAMAIEVG